MENSKTVFIGIDPGKDGAIAVVGLNQDKDNILGDVIVRPFGIEMYVVLLRRVAIARQSGSSVFVVVEHVNAMPGQGVTSCFSFGQNFGTILGMLEALLLPYELVRPQKWKKLFSCTSDKNTSIEVAKRLFPGVSLKRTDRCTKDHDGMAEALLMAEYARRARA